MVTPSTEERMVRATISVQIPGGDFITRKLKDGESLVVGSDDNADLRLHTTGVSGMHCMIDVENGVVGVRDCFSQSGTFLNNERITEAQITRAQQVRVGPNVLLINPLNTPVGANGLTVSSDEKDSLASELVGDQVQSFRGDHDSATRAEKVSGTDFTSESVDDTEVDQLRFELTEAQSEIEVLRERLAATASQPKEYVSDPFQEEMIEMLKNEVVALQDELTQRERSHVHEDSIVENDADLPSQEEVEQLVRRLETLLAELHERDQQIQMMQDLMRSGEEATEAEYEERRQLTCWLNEFEERFEQYKHEQERKIEQLRSENLELKRERDEAIAAMMADDAGAKAEALERLTKSMKLQVRQLQSELKVVRDQNRKLRTDLEECEETALREEEIRLSRERAELARMRHSLEAKLSSLPQLGPTGQAEKPAQTESELKLQDFRQHLRDTSQHAQEESSLSTRIAKLWRKMNS